MTDHEVQPVSEQKEDDLDTDAILAELENEEASHQDSAYASRLEELKSQQPSHLRPGLSTAQLSPYQTLSSDDEALQFTTTNPRAILHFSHADFARCTTMDRHLTRIASRHAEAEAGGEDTVFAKVDVEKAPFVVERLGVRVLPCVLGFVDGVVKGRVTGFEGLVWEQDGRSEWREGVTVALEAKMVEWRVLKAALLEEPDESDEDDKRKDDSRIRRGIRGATQRTTIEDDDWD